MMKHTPPPEWVTGRANCRADLKFEALWQIVERDVAEFNNLPEEKRPDGRLFDFIENGEGVTPVLHVEQRGAGNPGSRRSVSFGLTNGSIRIKGVGSDFTVTPKWAARERECRCYIDGKHQPTELWDVSRLALEPLFFGLG